MAGDSCILIPKAPNGEDSKLYKDLLEKTKNRPLTNYIYASYLVSGVADKMDSIGYTRGKQGEHSKNAVWKYFGVQDMRDDSINISRAMTSLINGNPDIMVKDSSGNITDVIDDVEAALKECKTFNDNHSGLVATVLQQGDKFRYLIDVKDSRTVSKADRSAIALNNWNDLRNAFNTIGISIDNLILDPTIKTFINPTKAWDATIYLDNLTRTRNDILTASDIRILMSINPTNSGVQALLNRAKYGGGSIDVAVQKIKDILTNPKAYSSTDIGLINTTLDACKNNLTKINPNTVLSNMEASRRQVRLNSFETLVDIKLDELNNLYGINKNEILLTNSKLDRLSIATQKALYTLENEKRKLIKEGGDTKTVAELEKAIEYITRAIKGGKYYMGCVEFLREANEKITTLDDLIKNIPTTGTSIEFAHERAVALLKIKDIMDGYYDIVKVMSKIDELTIDENIGDTEKKIIKDQAEIIAREYERATAKYDVIRRETMFDYFKSILGGDKYTDYDIRNLLDMTDADARSWEMLYSIADMSNPILGVAGKLIRDAQDSRDAKMIEISRRIREATNKLKGKDKSGAFMYEKNGYNIISDIDWDSYNKARRSAYISAKKLGLTDYELKRYLDQWEEANTEERVVDNTNGRTERVPNSKYRKAFPSLTLEQMEYYNTMMQIKGEIGSLLPEYAQKQYLAPQVRTKFLDALSQDRSTKGVARAVKNLLIDKFSFTVREDDTNFWHRGIIDGEEYGVTQGGMDGTPLRQIPIFYINKIKKGEDVLRNFSQGIARLAGTAINYDAMSGIREDLEFIQDYVGDLEETAKDNNGLTQADRLSEMGVQIVKKLTEKQGNNEIKALLASMIDSQLLGIKNKNSAFLTKLIGKINNYNSVKALSSNIRGWLNNYFGAIQQTIIEAGGHEFYGFRDLGWGFAKLLGDGLIGMPGHIVDFVTNNRSSYDTLIMEKFDTLPGGFDRAVNESYHPNLLRKILGLDFLFGGYGIGEFWVHKLNGYAMLHSKKVLIDGKKSTLYDAFEKVGDKDNPTLVLKNNVTDLDGVPITEEYLEKYRKLIRGVAQSINGAMTEADKGVIHQYATGKLVMNLRQWMPQTYGRRFRGKHYNADFESSREGYRVTTFKFVAGLLKDYVHTRTELSAHWNSLNAHEKANIKRRFTSFILLQMFSLFASMWALDDKKKVKNMGWFERLMAVTFKRCQMELESTDAYMSSIESTVTMINSPVPSVNTIMGIFYPFAHIEDINETVGRGKKAENKYLKNIKKYSLPWFKDIEYYQELEDNPNILSIFDNQYQNR